MKSNRQKLSKHPSTTTASSSKEGSRSPAFFRQAFTLIELLVVIAIIGILSSVVLASLSGARSNARDTRRQSDLSTIRTGLELYINKHDVYPSTIYSGDFTNGPYVSQTPVDPEGGEYGYESKSSGTSYCVAAGLEATSTPRDDTDCTVSGFSNTHGGEVYSISPDYNN